MGVLKVLAKDGQGRYNKNHHMRKFATVPYVVAIAIKEVHGIDVLDPETFKDPVAMKKFKHIMQTEFKDLVENT